jgi:glycosyltransferase involved in cell wall biosynthesis
VVGGASPEGDWSAVLRQRTVELGLQDCVKFLGALAPEELKVPLSAADVFVLATSNEGWANVFLEAMACGLPVVTTDVGGNAEVVADGRLGMLVPFGDRDQLAWAMSEALRRDWDRDYIVAHAAANSWNQRVDMLTEQFDRIVSRTAGVDMPGRPIRCA